MSGANVCACCAILFFAFQDAPQAGTPQEHDGGVNSQSSRPRVSGHPPSLYMLIPGEIQRELRLSEAQRSESRALLDSYIRDTRDGFLALRTLSTPNSKDTGGVDGDARDQVVVRLNRQSRDYERRVLAILSEAQRVRLRQLKLQAKTVWIFFDASVREKLQIEEEQMRSIVEKIEDAERLGRETARRAERSQAGRVAATARVEQLRDDAWIACLQHLSVEQRAALDQLRGPEPAFEVDKLRFGVGLRNGR